MLDQEHLTDIPFKKDNTFCFDNKSFQYLAAKRCNINFDDYQKRECKNSWNRSVAQSIRLLKFIQTRQPYDLQNYQSPRKVILDINMLSRPLMETLRLIIYNWKISEAKIIFNQITINCQSIDIEMCTYCAQTNIEQVGPYWLTQYRIPNVKTNENQHDFCPLNQNHFLIEFIVEHEFPTGGAGLKNKQWQSAFHQFLLDCDRLHHFLKQQEPSAEDDPFESILQRFIDEEQQLSQLRELDYNMNKKVREFLQSIKQIRQQNSQQLFDDNERLSVRDVYKIIDQLLHIDTVAKQFDCIKRTRQLIMKKNETRISANLIQQSTCL